MLRSDPDALEMPFLLRLISALEGGAPPWERQTGCYEVCHHGSSEYLPGYNHWPELANLNSYGVTDSLAQLLAAAREEVVEGPRIFLITLTPVVRQKQTPSGGWRWHKWGPYIGIQLRSGCEYLYDEPAIDLVYTYRVYEKNP
jgi:hypothetical protein